MAHVVMYPNTPTFNAIILNNNHLIQLITAFSYLSFFSIISVLWNVLVLHTGTATVPTVLI